MYLYALLEKPTGWTDEITLEKIGRMGKWKLNKTLFKKSSLK